MAGSRNRSDSTRVVGPPSSISFRNRNEKFIDTSTEKRNIIIIHIYLDRTDASLRGYEGTVFILRLTRPLCPVFTRDGSMDPCGGEVPRGWITRLLPLSTATVICTRFLARFLTWSPSLPGPLSG